MQAKFEIKIAANGEYMFNLYAVNGKVIATSETYTTLQSCKKGIESVKMNAKAEIEDQTVSHPQALPFPKYELYIDKQGKYRFHLCASNGRIISASQGYTAKANALGGIQSIGANAGDAVLVILD